MRILIVSNTYPPADISGVGALVYELAHQLGARGHAVSVLTRKAPPGDLYAVGTEGPKLLYPLLAGFTFLRLLFRRRFDLVHVHESDGVFVVVLLRLLRLLGLTGARLVSTLQVSYRRERWSVREVCSRGPAGDGRVLSRPTPDEWLFAFVRAPIHAFLGRVTVWLSDALVAPSRVTAGELEEDYGARNVRVIPNGIRCEDLEAAGRRRLAADTGSRPPTVLYVGRLRTRKAVAVLLEAFVLVRRELRAAHLVLVGDGEQRAALEAQKTSLGLGEEVVFTGALPREKIVDLYAAADVYCLPSLYEGFPVAILEAMAAALPVVSTTVSGIPEAVMPGQTGELVEPEDVAALARELLVLLEDPVKARVYGEAGRALLAERFSIEVVTRAYLALWQEVGGGQPGAAP